MDMKTSPLALLKDPSLLKTDALINGQWVAGSSRFDVLDPSNGRKLADVLMQPTRIYVKPVLKLMRTLPVKGLAHITGGGLLDNIPRILGDKLTAEIKDDRQLVDAIFVRVDLIKQLRHLVTSDLAIAIAVDLFEAI